MEKFIFILAVLIVLAVLSWYFELYINQCYAIVWSLQKKQKVKTWGLDRQIKEN